MNKFLLNIGGLLVSCLITLGLGGCGGKVPQTTYYSLQAPQDIPASTHQSGRLALLIGPISLPDILKNQQIVTGHAGDRYLLSENHRWSGKLDHDFARSIGEYLANRLGTEQIALYPLEKPLSPTHQVVCDVLTMDGMIGQDARLVVRWSLLDPTTKAVRMTRRSFCRAQPADNSYEAWVAAQRSNIRCLGEEIAAGLGAKYP